MGTNPLRDGISDNNPPPDAAERWIPIISPQVGVPVNVVLLNRRALGVYTHWVQNADQKGKGRTVPHTTPDDTCPICVTTAQRPRWHGYVGGFSLRSHRYCVVDLTMHAVQTCKALSPDSGVNLRGLMLKLSRIGTSNNSPVRAELTGESVEELKLPAEFDVKDALLRLWGMTTMRHIRVDDLEGRG